MSAHSHRLIVATTTDTVAAVVGLLVSLVVILNLHIMVGLEEGYAASPSEVMDFSLILAVADVALLIIGPALGVLAATRLRRTPH
jgi:hypothetical protein